LKRQTLLKHYSDSEDYLETMPDDNFLALLQKSVGNIKEKIEHYKAQLKRKDPFLLVAGK